MHIYIGIEVDVDRHFGRLKGVSKSCQVPFDGLEAAVVLTWLILK